MQPSSPKGPWRALKATSGFEPRQHLGDVALDVDARDAIAAGLQRVGAGVARRQRHRPFARPAAHQHRDVFGHSRPRSACSRAPLSANRRLHIGVPEIIALEQQRFAQVTRQRIGEAVAEIEAGRIIKLLSCPVAIVCSLRVNNVGEGCYNRWRDRLGSLMLAKHISHQRMSERASNSQMSNGQWLRSLGGSLMRFVGFSLVLFFPFILSGALIFFGRELVYSWTVKTDAEVRLERSGGYTYEAQEALGSETTVGKALSLAFAADCPTIGVIAQLHSHTDENRASLEMKVVRLSVPDTAGSSVDTKPDEPKCEYLLIGMSGRQENHGHQIADGSLVGTHYYHNPNNDYPIDTVIALKVDQPRAVDAPLGRPDGWEDVGLLEFAIEGSYTYLSPLGDLFAAALPYSRVLETVVATDAPRLMERWASSGGAEEVAKAFDGVTDGLSAFLLNITQPNEVQVVASADLFRSAQGYNPKAFFSILSKPAGSGISAVYN